MKLLMPKVAAVLAIAAFVASISVFAGETTAAKTDPKKSDSITRLKKLDLALQMYAQDYDYVLPPMTDFATVRPLLAPYLEDKSAFINPHNKQPFLPNPSLSVRHLIDIYDESYRKKHDNVAFYGPAPKGDFDALLLPQPTGRKHDGVLFWGDDIHSGGIGITGMKHPSYPALMVKRIAGKDWPPVKKASNLP